MKNIWYEGKDLKVLFGKMYGNWCNFDRMTELDTSNRFSKKQRVMLFFRYKDACKNKLMSFDNICIKTGISLNEVKSFFKWLRTPDMPCPVVDKEYDKYEGTEGDDCDKL